MHVRTRAAALAASLSTVLVVAMTGTAAAADDVDCSDFTYQDDAQLALDLDPADPNNLDGTPPDGTACESLQRRADRVPTTPAPPTPPVTVATTPPSVPPATTSVAAVAATPADPDRDCPDFVTQAAAQAALTSRTGDPERLDADGDGIACEQHFGTDGRQVAVYPLGGVATGGFPAR